MSEELERLQKVIAKSGYTSRRKAEKLIEEGLVTVNHERVTELGTKVKETDHIEVEGFLLKCQISYIYYSINQLKLLQAFLMIKGALL